MKPAVAGNETVRKEREKEREKESEGSEGGEGRSAGPQLYANRTEALGKVSFKQPQQLLKGDEK